MSKGINKNKRSRQRQSAGGSGLYLQMGRLVDKKFAMQLGKCDYVDGEVCGSVVGDWVVLVDGWVGG
jgi:hypothetical protein